MLTEVKVKVLMLERCLVMMSQRIIVANCIAKIILHSHNFSLGVVSISMLLTIAVIGSGAVDIFVIGRRRNGVVVVDCRVWCMNLSVRSCQILGVIQMSAFKFSNFLGMVSFGIVEFGCKGLVMAP